MSSPGPPPGPIRRRCVGPRTVSAMALVVLGVCAAAIVVFPARPVSLRSLPNWELAKLLPGVHDFPPSWNYSRRGAVQRVDADRPDAAPPNRPATYRPSDCANIPAIATLFNGYGYSAMVHVDKQSDQIARAVLQSSDEPDPNARFVIYPVADGAAMITKYVDWLHGCGTYHVTATDPDGGAPVPRVAVTTIGARSAGGADAALEVTRSATVTVPGPLRTMVYHVSYYWVRGVLLECATNLTGADTDLVNRVAAQTLQRIRTR
ncbi:hypothetical protein MAHJHV61_34200 [Mycobacterium avium subsp. hominissuis]